MPLDAADYAQTPEEAWDEKLWREGRAKQRRLRRKQLGRPERLAALRAALVERQNGLCHYCDREMEASSRVKGGKVPDAQATLEHLISFAEGGETSEQNCRAVCYLCNCLKGGLDQAIRAMERSMRSDLAHEHHYYAQRLREALARWEDRIALATAAREGGDVKQAPAESPQSGPRRGATPTPNLANNNQGDAR